MSFHEFPTAKDAPDLGTARVFTGDGSALLKVPGIVSVSQVRIGDTILPLFEERTYPTDSTGTKFEDREEKMLDIQTDPADGTPTLLRSKLSNDGLWQAGQIVYVSGEWEDEKKPAKKATAPLDLKPAPETP